MPANPKKCCRKHIANLIIQYIFSSFKKYGCLTVKHLSSQHFEHEYFWKLLFVQPQTSVKRELKPQFELSLATVARSLQPNTNTTAHQCLCWTQSTRLEVLAACFFSFPAGVAAGATGVHSQWWRPCYRAAFATTGVMSLARLLRPADNPLVLMKIRSHMLGPVPAVRRSRSRGRR